MKNKQINITKSSGETAPFSSGKLVQSMQRAGASEDVALDISDKVSTKLYEGMSTKKIYRIAFDLLKKADNPLAAKYKLKEAIMELGPSGYPFEKYVAAILNHQGYRVKVGEFVKGKCVNHEVDIIAEKDNQHFMIECKYHNQRGTISDVKIPLYIQSRFIDVEATWVQIPGHGNKFHQGWVVTNTKFSTDAVQYGNCAGLKLLGWDYPNKESLREQINKSGLYPITCLTTLTKVEKQRLLDKKIVLCMELCKDHQLLMNIGISESRIEKILKEAHILCEGGIHE